MTALKTMLAAVALIVTGQAAVAAEFQTMTLADGTELTYAVALPAGYQADRSYSVVLALPPGGQERSMVTAGLNAYWEDEGTRRNYVVVSPAAPGGTLFFRGAERHLPAFMQRLAETYNVAGGKFHLAGVSNGGLSAFRVATTHPERFHSVTVVPGFPPAEADLQAVDGLRGVKVNMFVGANDVGWLQPMQTARERLEGAGVDVYFEVVPGAGHIIQSLSGPNAGHIFDQIPG